MTPFDVIQPAERPGDAPAFTVDERGRLPQGAADAIARDGVVCLKNVLGPDEIAVLRQAVDAAVEAPSENGYRVANPGDPAFFFTDYNLWQRFDGVKRVAFESQIADLAASLVASKGMTLYFDNIFVKEGGSTNVAPWHEDAMYLRMNGTVLNFWIALDPVPEDSAVLFKRGSHKRDCPKYLAVHFDKAKGYFDGLTSGRVPMPDFQEIEDGFETVWWAAEPGDAVVFTTRTLHASLPNRQPNRRRALGFLLLADDVTFDEDPGVSDPPFRGENLVHGGAPQCASFPRLR